MKTYIILLLILLPVYSFAQTELSEKEQKGIDELINSSVIIDADAFKSQALNKILDADFFEATVVYKHMGIELTSEMMLVKHNDAFSKFYGVDGLLPLIKPSYKMSTPEQAADFEKVLDKLFPIFMGSNKESYQKELEWFFIRDMSFGEKEGVVVTVDNNGKIVKIENKGGIK